jgi:copper chaperone CopZ
MNRLRFSAALIVLAGLSITAGADDKGTKPERLTCRVIGLFSHDREKDLRTGFAELTGVELVSINLDEGEITVEFVPAMVFPGAKPEQRIEQLDNKVRNATHGTFSVKPRRTVDRNKLEKIEIPVAGLDCKACALAAHEILARIDGVEQAVVDFKSGRITTLIDPGKTSQAKLEEALRQREVTVIGKKKK